MANNLKICLSIIQFLDKTGPQALSKIEISTITKADLIRKCLNLLIEQRLIEKTTNHDNKETYANTDRGERILEFFHVKF